MLFSSFFRMRQLISLFLCSLSSIFGKDVSSSSDNDAALVRAVDVADLHAVVSLLSAGASVKARGVCGSVLQRAVWRGHKDIARVLLEAGADPNDAGSSGIEVQDVEKELKVLKFVNKFVDVQVERAEVEPWIIGDEKNTSLLCWNVEGSKLGIVFNAYRTDVRFFVAPSLLFTSFYGILDMTELLLEFKANVTAVFQEMSWSNTTWTPLALAWRGNHSNIASLLLEAGPNMEVELLSAISANDVHAVKVLLDRGAALPPWDRYFHLSSFFSAEMRHLLCSLTFVPVQERWGFWLQRAAFLVPILALSTYVLEYGVVKRSIITVPLYLLSALALDALLFATCIFHVLLPYVMFYGCSETCSGFASFAGGLTLIIGCTTIIAFLHFRSALVPSEPVFFEFSSAGLLSEHIFVTNKARKIFLSFPLWLRLAGDMILSALLYYQSIHWLVVLVALHYVMLTKPIYQEVDYTLEWEAIEKRILEISLCIDKKQLRALSDLKWRQSPDKSRVPWFIVDSYKRHAGGADEACSICCDPEQQEQCLQLPCEHVFHVSCIEEWLKSKIRCPLCRLNLLDAVVVEPKNDTLDIPSSSTTHHPSSTSHTRSRSRSRSRSKTRQRVRRK